MAAAARARVRTISKQIGLACTIITTPTACFPPAAIVDKKGKPLLSWRVSILPFIEQDNLYKQFHLDEPWDSKHNLPLANAIVKIYTLPVWPTQSEGYTHYRAFVGNGAAFDLVQGLKF